MSKSSPVDSKLQIVKKTELRYKQGRKYLKAKQYKRALKCYLYAFDNGHLVGGWGGVRLSYIPSAIAQIGKHHPPALEALRKRRDAREKLIERGETDFDVINEWTAINSYLKVQNYELDFIDRMKKKGRLNEELLERVISENKEVLLQRQDYDRLGPYLNKFGWLFLVAVACYQAEKDFPYRSTKVAMPLKKHLSHLKNSARKQGVQCFQIALGCGRFVDADKILQYLLPVIADRQTFAALIKAAKLTEQKSMERKLQRLCKR